MTGAQDAPALRRSHAIGEIRRRFLDRGFPRLVMSVLVATAGGAAFLTAYFLLGAGVRAMSVRYAIGAAVAYAVLLGLFRIWLWASVRRVSRARNDSSVLDLIPDGLDLAHAGDVNDGPPVPAFGGGGGFSGGGAGRSWGGDPIASSKDTSSGGGMGLDLDLDDGWVIVIPIVALVAIVIAAGAVVSTAPVLMAELLLDGLVAAGIYRRLQATDSQHWLAGATRRTWLPALGVIAIAGVAGWLIQFFAPSVVSIGDLWR